MKGRVGCFYYENRQIGGFLNWEITFRIVDLIDGNKKVFDWKASTKKFWFTEFHRELTACFLDVINGELILVNKHVVRIEDAVIVETGKVQTGYLEMVRKEDNGRD